MSKQAGFPFQIEVDNSAGASRDISNDVTNFNFATPRGVQDTTGVDKSAMERLLLLADFSITLNGVFNPAAEASHEVFSDLDNARTTTLTISGQVLETESLYTDYALTRNQDGSLTWSAPGVLEDGTVPDWGTV
jgi:hypothetical protein